MRLDYAGCADHRPLLNAFESSLFRASDRNGIEELERAFPDENLGDPEELNFDDWPEEY